MKIYNTLSRQKEEFKPIGKTATMYSCGPTVYNYAHIGNLRTYIFMDLLRKTLKADGHKIKGVMNITDVGHLLSDADEGEDKMVTASKKLQKTPIEIADYYTGVFMEDLLKLNIEKPEVTPKATDHIKEMISFVEDLIEKGYAYHTTDGIYFDIEKFEGYGKLSRINLEEQIAGARVEVNAEKRHPADFALWKHAPKEHIMKWESPWGLGYPGWHIECSAMSKKYLGEVFDLHTGGVDHIPIHHENEIAQAEAHAGKKTVNYWMHSEFMLVNNGKMSKKLGNTYTISQLADMGYSPMVFRYFCLNAHYRKKLNFTFEGMDASKVSLERLYNLLALHRGGSTEKVDLTKYKTDFYNALFDDINAPQGLGVMWDMVRRESKNKAVYDLAIEFDKILSLDLKDCEKHVAPVSIEVPAEVLELAKQRLQAKKDKDYAKSDELRNKAIELGYNIIDTKEGYDIKKVR